MKPKNSKPRKVPIYEHTWMVKKFSSHNDLKVGEVIFSGPFSSGRRHGELKWRLGMAPNGFDEGSKGYLSIYVHLVSSNKPKVQAKYKLSILNAHGEEFVATTDKRVFIQGTISGLKTLISRKELFDKDNKLLPGDKLTVYCEMSVSDNMDAVAVPECRRADEYSYLLDTQRFTDFTILVSGKKFLVHKAILAARSDVFAAWFEHGVKEQQENRVEIPDIKPEVFQELLQFVYTDRTSKLNQMGEDLLMAANKYSLERLQVLCEEALAKSLSVDNVVKALKLADVCSADQLKDQAITFINMHPTEVTKTEGWKSLMKTHPELVNEAYCALATDGPPKKKKKT